MANSDGFSTVSLKQFTHPFSTIPNSQSSSTLHPYESHYQHSTSNHSIPTSNLLFNPSTDTHTSFQQQSPQQSLTTTITDNSSSIPHSHPRLPAYICIYDNQIISLRYCRICKIYQPPRSYHCSQCHW